MRSQASIAVSPVAPVATSPAWRYGAIKWFDPVRRFGFVLPDDGDTDVFLYFKVLRSSGIREADVIDGARVKYQCVETAKRPEVTRIQIVTRR